MTLSFDLGPDFDNTESRLSADNVDKELGAAPDAIFPGQWRLERLQLLNWGTFDGYVDIDVAREGFLITGGSGSGKSTLIDAMSSVLVPGDRVRFNAAAQQDLRRGYGRSLVSYIRGAWRRREDETSGVITSTYLRTGATYTAVALTYADGAGEQLTLAAYFYLKAGANSADSVNRLFGEHSGPHDISSLHHYLSRGINKRGFKADFDDGRFTESYSVFAGRFRQKLGIGSLEAQLLLHRTQSAKSLSFLDQLFREYMLTEPDSFAQARKAVEQFDDLRQAYEKVQDVRAQIEVLDPLPRLLDRRAKSESELDRLERMQVALPQVRDQLETRELSAVLRESEAKLRGAESAVDQTRAEVDALAERERRARNDLDSAGGLERGLLEARSESAQARFSAKDARRRDTARVLDSLGAELPDTAEAWDLVYADALTVRDEAPTEIESTRTRIIDARGESARLRTLSANLGAELDSLARRRSNIDAPLVELRQRLSTAIGAALEEMPFAGELIDVKKSERLWEPVAQRLLRGFAATLLVPEDREADVVRWIDATHLGLRLAFTVVPADAHGAGPSREPRALSNKLDVTAHAMRPWLLTELHSRHEYVCVENESELDTLRNSERGVTPRGLVRNALGKSGARSYIKDDTHALGDRRRYRLGSTNDEKVEVLRSEVGEVQREKAAVDAAADRLSEREQELRAQRDAAERILETSWPEIDSATEIAELERARVALQEWDASPERVPLAEAIAEAAGLLEEAKKAQEAANQKLGVLRGDRETHIRRLDELAAQRERLDAEEPAEELVAEIERRMLEHTRRITLSNIQVRTDSLRTRLDSDVRKRGSERERAIRETERILGEYLERWPAEKADIRVDADYAGEAVARLTTLRSDRLAEFTERFLALLNDSTSRALAEVAGTLRNARRDIDSRIGPINDSLLTSEFDAGRWLRIEVRDQRADEVREFQKELDSAITGAMSQVATMPEAEKKFDRLSVILTRLGSAESGDRRWQQLVLDTRRHVRFVGVEMDEASQVTNSYVDSASLSGGQAQKLVFFCLAAALRFQLAEPDDEYPRFASVVLDEAFDRADPVFTRTALNVFRRFGFHMILATPLKLIQTLDPYVGGTIVVSYRETVGGDGRIRAGSAISRVALESARGSLSGRAGATAGDPDREDR